MFLNMKRFSISFPKNLENYLDNLVNRLRYSDDNNTQAFICNFYNNYNFFNEYKGHSPSREDICTQYIKAIDNDILTKIEYTPRKFWISNHLQRKKIDELNKLEEET
ncbi:PIR protein [Plasmodium brasilianum]|uniref:PIR protein n=1 Tax=Plasmodium brasilianum TaxID=5824 RepID=A0ACB9YAD2_PLABR|nr:PIR protein [Plasmodium brasilianum]